MSDLQSGRGRGPSFDLGEFRIRSARVRRRLNRSYATLSKRLFTSARTLPELMDRTEPDEVRTFPGLHRLLLADRRLKAIEQALPPERTQKPTQKRRKRGTTCKAGKNRGPSKSSPS